jgi:hypothetical protein
MFLKALIKTIYKEKIIRLKQWWNETVITLGGDRYLLVHYINKKKVKLIVRKRSDKITAIVDEGYDECYMEEAEPFLLFEQEELSPEILGLDKALIIHTEDGKLIKKEVKHKLE